MAYLGQDVRLRVSRDNYDLFIFNDLGTWLKALFFKYNLKYTFK